MHAVIRSDESTCSRLATSMVRVVCTDVGLFLGESFVQGLPLMCLGRCRHVPQVVRFPLRRAVSRLHGLVRVIAGKTFDRVQAVGVVHRVSGLVDAVAEQIAFAHESILSPSCVASGGTLRTSRSATLARRLAGWCGPRYKGVGVSRRGQ